MQIYSLNYFLAHKISILVLIIGVFVLQVPYSAIANHKNCKFLRGRHTQN